MTRAVLFNRNKKKKKTEQPIPSEYVPTAYPNQQVQGGMAVSMPTQFNGGVATGDHSPVPVENAFPTFTIRAKDGKEYKISGPNLEGAKRALHEKLNPNNTGINSPTGGFKEAFLQGIDAPLDAMGTTAKVLGAEKTSEFLTNLTEAPEGYESSSAKFIKGDEDGSYAYRYLPKAAIEQGAQFAGQMMARAGGAAIGSTLGPGGAIVGGIAAPVIFSAVQHLGPLAEERARNQGRDKPNKDDFLYVSTSTAGIALLDSLGLGGGKIFSSALKEFGTESLQSVIEQTGATVNTEAGFNVDPRQAVGEGIIGGTSAGVVKTGLSAPNIIRSKPFENTEQSRAATAFATRIKKVAEENNSNLKDVNVKSTNGARDVITKAHTQIKEELRVLFSDLKPLVAVNDKDTLLDLEDKILAEAGKKEGNTLAKSQVGEQELDALDRLAGQTLEGQKARNLLLEMNELTALHKQGYKGGVSKVTDLANPLNNLTHPFSSQGGLTGLATTGAAYMAGGTTGLAIQGGAFAGGRAIDAITGNRSRVNKFIKKNTKANRETQLSPTGPSLREQAIAEAQQAESAAEAQKMEDVALNRHLAKIGAPPKGDPNDPNPSPQYALENATGLNAAEVETVLKQIEEVGGLPTLQRAIDSYRKSVTDGGKVSNLNELIRFIKSLKTPNARLNAEPQLSPQGLESQSSTVNAKLDAEPQFGPKFTTQENYNRGIEANKKFNADQKTALNKINNEGIMSESDYKTLSQAIDELDGNLGSKPLETFEAVYKKLEAVDPRFVQEIIDPMYERITKQQRQRTVKTSVGKTKQQLALPLFDSPLKIEGKVTVKKIGEAMNADHMQKHGRQFFPENNPEDYQQVYEYADAEINKQLEQPNSGVGWYSADVNESMELASEVFPTLATDETHRKLYLTFAGIFSNGADPDNAFMMSAGAFDDFLRTGEVPINRAEGFRQQGLEPPKTTFKDTRTKKKVTKDAGWGIRNQANEQQLGMLKYLSEREGGIQPALDFLLKPQSRADINALMLDSGLYKAGRFVTAKEKAGPNEYGFLAFGKKLGRYSLGLQGIDLDAGDTTIDLWYTRTFRRWTGRLLETPISKEGVAAQPANDTERESIFRMTGELADKYNLTPGDIQAVLWFFEKRTWGSQGLKTKEGTNSSGARKLLNERGVVPEQTAAFNPNDGTRSNGSNPSVSPTNEPGATRQGILGQFFGGGQRNAAPKNNDRSQPVSEAEIRAQIPVVQSLFEIGKKGSAYENGLKDFDATFKLASAYNIAPKLFRSFKDMERADPTITEGALGAYNPNNREAMAIMPGGVDAFGGTVSGLASLSYMIHEVAHGITGSDIDTNQFMGDKFVFNYLTNQDDTAGINSLEDVFGGLVSTPNSARSQNKIIAEMLAIQKNLTFKDPNTGQVVPLRQTKSLIDSYNAGQRKAKANGTRSEQFNKDVKAFEKQIVDQRNYEQSIPELTVNALQVAMMHPKIMKKVAPDTYKLLKHLFDNSKNKSGIKFFSHPLAMTIAVILAMMARGDEPPEEQQQPMPPGALTPAPGILAA